MAVKAIMMGPKNYLAVTYQGTPIGITVEGANILTRNMIIFGQGAVRSHPYLLKEMQALEDPINQPILSIISDNTPNLRFECSPRIISWT